MYFLLHTFLESWVMWKSKPATSACAADNLSIISNTSFPGFPVEMEWCTANYEDISEISGRQAQAVLIF